MINNRNNLKKLVGLFLFNLIIFIIFIAVFSVNHGVVYANTIKIEETIVPILTYHKFCTGDSPDAYTININRFEEQMAYLENNGYNVISITQLMKCIDNNFFPEKPVVITIDDGFKSVYTLAFPVLRQYQFPATLFLYTDFIDNGPDQLSWQEIKEMIDGGMEIGSHSLSHCNLLNMKQNESHIDYLKRIDKEITLSRAILERNTGSSVQSFAYPYGVYSQQIKMLAKQAGYQVLLNVNGMNNSIPIDAYSLNRQIIPASFSIKQFESLLQEKILKVNAIFPADGIVTDNQAIKVGAILNNSNIELDSLFFKLSGSGLLDYSYSNELQEISFTPVAPKLLQKRTWIAQISVRDKKTGVRRKFCWLFTVSDRAEFPN
jgi:peptidoglycan/xylan/chitin deacetylase (PgdA/CDA1 family)